jgi:hypothetical protein
VERRGGSVRPLAIDGEGEIRRLDRGNTAVAPQLVVAALDCFHRTTTIARAGSTRFVVNSDAVEIDSEIRSFRASSASVGASMTTFLKVTESVECELHEFARFLIYRK